MPALVDESESCLQAYLNAQQKYCNIMFHAKSFTGRCYKKFLFQLFVTLTTYMYFTIFLSRLLFVASLGPNFGFS